MKKIFAALFLLPLLTYAQTEPGSQTPGFIISGHIAGLPDSSEVKISNVNDKSIIAATKSLGEKFVLKGSIAEPGLYWLMLGEVPPQYIYLENVKMTISGSTSDPKTIMIVGSKAHQDFLAFQKIFNPLVGDRNGTAAKLNRGDAPDKHDSLMKKFEEINAAIQVQIDRFINERPASPVSPWLLFITDQLTDDVMLLEKRYNSLDPAIKNLQIGQSLAEYISYNKVGAVGTEAMDFSQPDTSGKTVALSSFRGKYVLVDFWASWCGPCRHENPNVVANYHKFKDKNFTILGVSLDKPGQKDKWIEAIKADSLSWTNVSDLQFWQNAAAQLYRVDGIPFNFLVDPNGKIIARNLRGPQLQEKLCELLGCN